MTNIPEDFNLRRHYLTEEKYKLQRESEIPKPTNHVLYTAAFIFLLVVLFL